MKAVQYSRAGHCPVLYYSTETGKAEYLSDKGAALGMVRNNSYDGMISSHRINYRPGDVMFLFTDGIIEARRPGGEEYGFERLASVLEQSAGGSPQEIISSVVASLHEVAGPEGLKDDHTILLLKFKEAKP